MAAYNSNTYCFYNCDDDDMIKLWDLYYWNKHDYRWIKIGISSGHTKYEAIRIAKAWYVDFVARGDMMKVVEYMDIKI